MYHEPRGGGWREPAVDTLEVGPEHEGVGEEGRSKPRDSRETRERSSTHAARNGAQACQDLGGETEELLVRKQEAGLLYPVPQELKQPQHVLVPY
jgi:hypothetical protein